MLLSLIAAGFCERAILGFRLAVVTGVIVALAAALISGSAGYELGLQHSRIDAAVQNINAVAPGSCPAGTASTASSAISPAGTALLARLLPVPKADKQVTVLKQGVLSLSDYVQELYPDNSAEQGNASVVPAGTAKFTVAGVADSIGIRKCHPGQGR